MGSSVRTRAGAAGAVLSLTRTAVNHPLIFGDFTGRAFFTPPRAALCMRWLDKRHPLWPQFHMLHLWCYESGRIQDNNKVNECTTEADFIHLKFWSLYKTNYLSTFIFKCLHHNVFHIKRAEKYCCEILCYCYYSILSFETEYCFLFYTPASANISHILPQQCQFYSAAWTSCFLPDMVEEIHHVMIRLWSSAVQECVGQTVSDPDWPLTGWTMSQKIRGAEEQVHHNLRGKH